MPAKEGLPPPSFSLLKKATATLIERKEDGFGIKSLSRVKMMGANNKRAGKIF